MKTAAVLAIVPVCALAAADEPAPQAMRIAADRFVASLGDVARGRACLGFDDDQRENFRYTPRERSGVPLKDMDAASRGAAMTLLDSALSGTGKQTALGIITLEGVLRDLENNPLYRDPEKYHVTIFGTPGDPSWAWKFEGHHLSLNYTVTPDGLAVTPMFLGSNPAEVRQGPKAGLRVLAAEEDLAMALARSLIDEGHDEVVFSKKAPAEILTGEDREASVLDPVGVAAQDMPEKQRAALLELVETYLKRHHRVIADAERRRIESAGTGSIRFGWAGGTRRGEAWYYRIQGPGFLMEAANTQNRANHVHTTWRSFDRDFGRDLLREHFEKEHPDNADSP